MSEYIYKIGEDNFPIDNREYCRLLTTEGLRITIALVAGGVPFHGDFDKGRISFAYDADYKDTVDEIISKVTSEEYAALRKEIEEHKENDCLYFLPTVANLLRMTEGTLRCKPTDIQLSLCKRYVDNWYCDTYTIQQELKDALMLITKPELTDSEKNIAVGKD